MTIRIKSKRINAKRPQQTSPTGLKRVVLAAVAKPESAHPPKFIRTPAKPKNRLLVIAHSIKSSLNDHALQTIAAAAILADLQTAVLVMVLGPLQQDLDVAGADEVMVLPTLDFQRFQPDVELATIVDVIDSLKPLRIFMPDNFIGDGDLGRRLIAHKQRTAATHVVEIDTKHVATYQTGGTALARSELPEVILLAPNTVESELPFTAKATRINAPIITDATAQTKNQYQDHYKDMGLQASIASDIALEEADFIVSAGNGVANLTTLAKLADTLGASVGASRVVVDDGKLPRDKQIGATGKTVTASTYMAVGISGAVQHLQGIKDCRHVIAINKDASAPMIKRADLSIIGDAEAIMQALIIELEKAKAKKAAQ